MSQRPLTRLLLIALVLTLAGGFSVVQAQGGDRDGDGLPDTADQCPDTPGPRENMGCPWPDGDGDGVPDHEDQCPDQSGPRGNNGCPLPDRDGDGVLDSTDQCPDQFGANDNAGCPWPDGDGDGVPDREDQCPAQPGSPENSSCPTDTPPDNPEPGLPPGPPPVNLPELPAVGQCMLATLGAEGVRIRQWPSTEAPVIGSLDPEQLYEVSQLVIVGDELWWWLSQGGFVADWVARYGGDNCLLLPAVQPGGGWLFKGSFNFGSDKMQDFHFLVMFDYPGEYAAAWDGVLGDDGSLKITPGAIAGFDPQPDPPGEGVPPVDPDLPGAIAGFDPQPDPPDEGIPPVDPDLPGTIAGFDPQPEPPVHPPDPGLPGEGSPPEPDLPTDFGFAPVLGFGEWGDPHLPEWGDPHTPGWFLGDLFGAMGDGSVMPSWLLPAMGDGSVKPGEAQVVFGDGSVMPVDPSAFLGDGSVMPSWLLPAMGGDSVMPSWLLPAIVFPDGGTSLGCVPVGSAKMGDPIPTESAGDPIPTELGALCSFTNGEVLAQCSVGAEKAFCAYSAY